MPVAPAPFNRHLPTASLVDLPFSFCSEYSPKPAKAPAGDKEKKGHSYSDKLEQKKHEKVGENRTKNMAARHEGKKL